MTRITKASLILLLMGCWDATYKGKPVNPGVFVYKVDVTLLNGKEVNQSSGNITVVK